LRGVGDFVRVQLLEPEVGSVVDKPSIFGSQRDMFNNGEICSAAINKYSSRLALGTGNFRMDCLSD